MNGPSRVHNLFGEILKTFQFFGTISVKVAIFL